MLRGAPICAVQALCAHWLRRPRGIAGRGLPRSAVGEYWNAVQSFLQTGDDVERLAQLAVLRGNARRSALLIGYVDAQYTALKMQRYAGEQSGYDKLMAALPETLSNDEIAQLTADGATWSEDQAIAEALKA